MKRKGLFGGAALALALLGCLIALKPARLPPHGYGTLTGRIILARDGLPLADLIHPRQQCGPWLNPEQIPELVLKAALAAEDRRFYLHPGVDPLALARAAWQSLKAGKFVSGGSTITMQLARLLHPAPRTLPNKIREMARALWLEAGLSKEEILCQYLNRAPFGGPLVGLGAASQALFAKEPARLAPQEAALLMALPQAPGILLRPVNRTRLRARRNYILIAMAQKGSLDKGQLERALLSPLKLKDPLPSTTAPHFVQALKRRLPAQAPHLVSTYLNPSLQGPLSRLISRASIKQNQPGLRQAAILVLRNRDGAVLAWVGSPDFQNRLSGQVDGVLARRQPGSSLKPFLYAIALERGQSLDELIPDEPMSLQVAGGVFRPEDFDRQYRGGVSLRVALASSLNLPALRLAQGLGPSVFLNKLHLLGFALPRPANHYGLGLTLGNGEVSLLELTNAYAALARGGLWLPPRLWKGQKKEKGRRVFSSIVCRQISATLADDSARAAGFGRHSLLELPFATAVKTGTSQRHRDNWCVGYTSQYTVGVWVGNFEGQPMKSVSGLTGAGPIWRQAMVLLQGMYSPDKREPTVPGFAIEEAEVAARPARTEKKQTVFYSTSQVLAQTTPRVELTAPLDGAVYALDPDLPIQRQVLNCQLRASFEVSKARWILNGKAMTPGLSTLDNKINLRPGRHLLEVQVWGPEGEAQARARFLVVP